MDPIFRQDVFFPRTAHLLPVQELWQQGEEVQKYLSSLWKKPGGFLEYLNLNHHNDLLKSLQFTYENKEGLWIIFAPKNLVPAIRCIIGTVQGPYPLYTKTTAPYIVVLDHDDPSYFWFLISNWSPQHIHAVILSPNGEENDLFLMFIRMIEHIKSNIEKRRPYALEIPKVIYIGKNLNPQWELFISDQGGLIFQENRSSWTEDDFCFSWPCLLIGVLAGVNINHLLHAAQQYLSSFLEMHIASPGETASLRTSLFFSSSLIREHVWCPENAFIPWAQWYATLWETHNNMNIKIYHQMQVIKAPLIQEWQTGFQSLEGISERSIQSAWSAPLYAKYHAVLQTSLQEAYADTWSRWIHQWARSGHWPCRMIRIQKNQASSLGAFWMHHYCEYEIFKIMVQSHQKISLQ